MASAWGKAWGLAFGVSWGAVTVTPPIIPPAPLPAFGMATRASQQRDSMKRIHQDDNEVITILTAMLGELLP